MGRGLGVLSGKLRRIPSGRLNPPYKPNKDKLIQIYDWRCNGKVMYEFRHGNLTISSDSLKSLLEAAKGRFGATHFNYGDTEGRLIDRQLDLYRGCALRLKEGC